MCGITGLVEQNGIADPEAVRRSAGCLAHRGPDDSGFWCEDGVALGHRRLKVLDLSPAAHQPMVSPDGRYVIVFNGEIYNYRELRLSLGGDAASWRSHGDTEVILAAYRRWGAECLPRLRGMFAFAIWDRQEKRLFAARDRLGVKPFYYHSSRSRIAFASRPRAVLALHQGISATIGSQALRFYLEAGYVPSPWSIHDGVSKLPPAHYLEWKDGKAELRRWWDHRLIVPDEQLARRSEEELLDELEELVSRSVRYRLESDVALGAFLSGGIDSSIVAAMMRRHANGPVKTFTIGFDDARYDESPHAEAIARHLGCQHTTRRLVVDDLLGLLPRFCEAFDEPFSDSAAFPTMALSQLAREHVTVALSGDGGDELFGGYHYYRIAQTLNPVFSLPRPVRTAASGLVNRFPGHRWKLLSGALDQDDAASMFAYARGVAKDFPSPLLFEVTRGTRPLSDLFVSAACQMPPRIAAGERAARLDVAYTLTDDYLQKVDLASMAFSLEAREPLLDHELLEWSMRLPWQLKQRRGEGKYLLRRLAYRLLPRQLLDRPKQGFVTPVDRWLRGPLKNWAFEQIDLAASRRTLPIDFDAVRRLMTLHQSGRRNVQPLLWSLLMLFQFTGSAEQ